jgi:hypothetical protein
MDIVTNLLGRKNACTHGDPSTVVAIWVHDGKLRFGIENALGHVSTCLEERLQLCPLKETCDKE